MDFRFCHDLTHKNGRNSLIYWTFSYLYLFKQSYLATYALRPIFIFFRFF